MKILVVDDDAINRLILQKLFERERHIVVTAENGLEALAILIEEDDIHVVITDIMMPEMDGIALLAEIKLNEKISKLPIIGFTAGDIDYFRSITPLSFDRLLPKPMNFHELYAITNQFVQERAN
ncbi:Response regulator containing CheY-like receiver, AAA-type ATPase, and DNA-binding domains [Aquiflexum balticum DSM 16537]|jgi:two-component system chemotaxis response regulator CheY|uniref:Response regulator containing CheY-like receiver, AAA-type ATPase, and DNA-binding domains n=1 Tax=Aquiflexum balticum DSM 16537 TaxID=758820 RepID=A0A1W2H3K2_9BACT|nr:response regulator [Aquiflexum balticum]SMD43208.1 Response regulator containing CheY-like receiver, AAA-type ATPase, and DNA-binding domains [Aquiflexum balticum DSM 16537]